jgi:transketolase
MELFSKDEGGDNLAVGAIRSLIIDETNHAKSGHPGMALDIAPALFVLFKNHLIADPLDPHWINRDRFVLSAGHCSALLYAMLHLAGYAISLEDLKGFRSLNSITPGHPEFGLTPGVDATAGPLAQGISQAVGMAMAEEAIRASYPEGEAILSHHTYCLCGDGCLEEGLSQEAISLAGKQKLRKLILIYDANGSTLDGPTANSLTENEKLRFLAAQWNVLEVKDGNDLIALDAALREAKTSSVYPTLVIVHTIIGFGSALQGSHKTHGTPLGEEDGRHAKAIYGYDYPDFTVPDKVYDLLKGTFGARGQKAHKDWEGRLSRYQGNHPTEAAIFARAFARDVAASLPMVPTFDPATDEATRATSGAIVAKLPTLIPFTLGGSADVASSVKTAIPGDPGFDAEHRAAKNVAFGIREFAMAGAQNGMLLHGGLVTYIGSFLVFSDYMKAAIRMSALEHLPAIYLFSHDSIAVGEDGPTHEPVEQLVALRSIPGLNVIRPCDARETYGAWRVALMSAHTPTALILGRQELPLLAGSSADELSKGAYLISPSAAPATLEFIATGSEVSLALSVQARLAATGIEAEVVSMPSTELFEAQNEDYKARVLHLPRASRIALEMLSGLSWFKYAENVISVDEFGKSGAPADVIAAYGFTPEAVLAKVLAILGK